MKVDEKLYGQPAKVTFHGIDFDMKTGNYYEAAPVKNIKLKLTCTGGCWESVLTVRMPGTYKNHSLVIEGHSQTTGKSIDPAVAVALALTGLRQMTVHMAELGNRLGLTVGPCIPEFTGEEDSRDVAAATGDS